LGSGNTEISDQPEAIFGAVTEGVPRLERPNLSGQPADIAASDVGRVNREQGNATAKGVRQAPEQIGDAEAGVANAVTTGIASSQGHRLP